MALMRKILTSAAALSGGRQPIRFFFGGTGISTIASAAACIGASQPPEQLNVDLSGIIPLFMGDKGITDIGEASPLKETSGVYTKLSEDLVAV